LYIKRVQLDNIRCFESLDLQLRRAGASALFLGDNGDGKSTVLRCIAMGLCDDSSAAALFRELSGTFIRHSAGKGAEGSIRIDMEEEDGTAYRMTTKIQPVTRGLRQGFERVEQTLEMIDQDGNVTEISDRDQFPWERIFVAGYGPGLRTGGTEDYERYLAVDAVYPLFIYDQPLQNPELIIRRLVDAEKKAGCEPCIEACIQDLMAELLGLRAPGDFDLTATGLQVTAESWGTEGLGQLGDGYQATITWVMDLMSWWFLREAANGNTAMELGNTQGVVIVDEIEQHLHPKWQRRLIPLLRERFPKVQFIIATHSPLVASSSADVEVHLFENGRQRPVEPYGWLAEDVYDEMGVEESRAPEFSRDLARYDELDLKIKRDLATENDKREMAILRDEIAGRLRPGDPADLILRIQNIGKADALADGTAE
jgi:hypothetical protein